MEDLYPMLDALMTWFIVPIVGFLWIIHQRQQDHQTAIRVLEARTSDAQIVHDREIKEIKDTTEKIFQEIKEVRQCLNERNRTDRRQP